MTAFEHVLVLLSFVYALALTHLLSRIVTLYNSRARITFSGLLATAIANAILIVFVSWLALWPFRSLKDWDLFSIVTQFVYSVLVYFLCALAAPEASNEGRIDLDEFYSTQRKSFYAVYLLICVAGIAGNFTFLRTSSASLFLAWNLASVALAIPPLLALIFTARWVQWAAGMALVAMMMAALVILEPVLS